MGSALPVLRGPGNAPDGTGVARGWRQVVRAIRARWPRVEMMVRGDSHYGRPQARDWLGRKRIGYVFGLAGNKVLLGRVVDHAEDAAMGRIEGEAEKVRSFAAFD